MKAIEYYEKHKDNLLNPQRSLTPPPDGANFREWFSRVVGEQLASDRLVLVNDFLDETSKLVESRKIKLKVSFTAVIREQNQKWNALVALFEKHHGHSPITRNHILDLYRLVEEEMESGKPVNLENEAAAAI